MRTVENGVKGSKVTALLEWQTCDTDAEWHTSDLSTLTAATLQAEGTLRPTWVPRHWRLGVALLMIFATIGSWTWSVAQRGVDQIEAELRDSVELDLWTTAKQDDGLRPASEREIQKRSITMQGDTFRPVTSTVHLLELAGETAIVQLVTQSGPEQPALRQTGFYLQTAEGWQRTKPNAELWGPPRHLESAHFIFHYRQNDAQAVAAVAPQIDHLFTTLLHNFGLTPSAEKLVIEVTVEQVTGATPIPQWPREHLVMPSPAVYLAPVELSDAALLAQSIALPLIEYMGDRAIEEHAIPTRWRSLLHGLRLWQLWDLDIPLANWRQELVKWFYIDIPIATVDQQSVLPDRYRELCAVHRLWMLSPVIVGIPLECSALDAISWSPRQWPVYVPSMGLDQLRVPLADWKNSQYSQLDISYDSMGVATLIEYVVAVYGVQQLPVLLAGLPRHNDWETLVPAVFGVSASNFEAGWRSYLVQQYNVSLGN